MKVKVFWSVILCTWKMGISEEPVIPTFRIHDSTLKLKAADSSTTSALIYQIYGARYQKTVIPTARPLPGRASNLQTSYPAA
jgi:hypothetical protein